MRGYTTIIPLNKDDINKLIVDITKFARLLGKYDSLGRLYAWIDLRKSLQRLLDEEKLHDFEFPSPHNSQKEWVLKELEE